MYNNKSIRTRHTKAQCLHQDILPLVSTQGAGSWQPAHAAREVLGKDLPARASTGKDSTQKDGAPSTHMRHSHVGSPTCGTELGHGGQPWSSAARPVPQHMGTGAPIRGTVIAKLDFRSWSVGRLTNCAHLPCACDSGAWSVTSDHSNPALAAPRPRLGLDCHEFRSPPAPACTRWNLVSAAAARAL